MGGRGIFSAKHQWAQHYFHLFSAASGILPYFLYYTPVSNKRPSLTNAWCKPTVHEINPAFLINAGGMAQYPHSNHHTCYGDKEKSLHCNNWASDRRSGWDVKGGSCNVGEELLVNCEYGNKHDEHTIAVLNDSEIVSHLPRTILCISCFFLRRGGHIICRVTGKRRHDDGLEVPCVYVYFGNVKTIIHVHECGHELIGKGGDLLWWINASL